GGCFEAAVAALGGTQDIRLEGSIMLIVPSCAAPPGGTRRHPSRSRGWTLPRRHRPGPDADADAERRIGHSTSREAMLGSAGMRRRAVAGRRAASTTASA